MAPSYGESNSFSTSRTSLVTGCFKIWLGPPFSWATLSVRQRLSFFESTSTPTILVIDHLFRWQSSHSKAISPTTKFRMFFFHICLTCRLWRNSFLDLLQNSPAICCTRRHILFEYASYLLNSSGGGMTILAFVVGRLLGESSIALFESRMVSTVSGREIMISPTLSDSSFKEWLRVFNNPSKIVLADRTWRSQTPPIGEAPGGLLCHRIQSAPFFCEKPLILSCFISLNARCNSFLAPTKFVPFSDQIKWTVLLLVINLQSSKMKESASNELVKSMCTARLEKHVKRAP